MVKENLRKKTRPHRGNSEENGVAACIACWTYKVRGSLDTFLASGTKFSEPFVAGMACDR